jgi:hypothetical protein
MLSVPDPTQLPTILDCIEVWLRAKCKVCARFIDSVQISDDEDGLTQFKRAMRRCSACSEGGLVEPQPPLTFHPYDMRRRLGLVPIYDPEARWTPLHPSLPHATLVVARAYLPDRQGQPKKGPAEPFVDYLMAAGLGQEVPASEADRAQISAWPHYRLVPLGSQESRLEGDPDGTHDRAVPERRLALIELAALVNHPAVPGAATLLRWDEFTPNGFSEETLGLHYIDPDRRVSQVEKLDKATRQFVAGWEPHPGGRPSLATRQDDLKAELVSLADRWRAERRQSPKSIGEFAIWAQMPISTLRDHLQAAGLGPWSNFRKRYLPRPPLCRQRRNTRVRSFP